MYMNKRLRYAELIKKLISCENKIGVDNNINVANEFDGVIHATTDDYFLNNKDKTIFLLDTNNTINIINDLNASVENIFS